MFTFVFCLLILFIVISLAFAIQNVRLYFDLKEQKRISEDLEKLYDFYFRRCLDRER